MDQKVPAAQPIKINLIDPGKNPRRYFDQAAHDSLVASIRARGLIQPIGVREKPEGRYEIVFGERRWRAMKVVESNFGEIPAIVFGVDDDDALVLAVMENEERQEASRTEQADAAAKLLERNGGDRDETARVLGWSRAKLDTHLALGKLSPGVKAALDERRIKLGHAELLAACPPEKQDTALETILKAKLTVDKTAELLLKLTHSLAKACFDKADCAGCEFNSSIQRALFETHVAEGHCTNPPCYELKTQTFEKAQAAEATAAASTPAPVETTGNMPDDEEPVAPATLPAPPVKAGTAPVSPLPAAPRPAAPASASPAAAAQAGSPIADCRRVAKDARETQWRKTCANSVVADPAAARVILMSAAFDGTLGDIERSSLTIKADRLFGAGFAALTLPERLETIATMPADRADVAFAAIAGAYIMNCRKFETVADIAVRWRYDIRNDWSVNKVFLGLFTKPMLREIAIETGLAAHIGERTFARLYGSKRDDLIAGMLNAQGFEWKGRLPSAMTLDGRYGAPLVSAGASLPASFPPEPAGPSGDTMAEEPEALAAAA